MAVIQRLREKLEARIGRQVKSLADCEAVARSINEAFRNRGNAEASQSIGRDSSSNGPEVNVTTSRNQMGSDSARLDQAIESCNPKGCESTSSKSVSRHSIARIFGITEHAPGSYPGTMDMIARYLDFENAGQMYRELGEEQAMFSAVDFIDSNTLNKGARIHLSYEPGRDLLLTYLGDGRYIVNESLNSKLVKGDELYMMHLARGFELRVDRVIRNGVDIGSYDSARCGGLTSLEIV